MQQHMSEARLGFVWSDIRHTGERLGKADMSPLAQAIRLMGRDASLAYLLFFAIRRSLFISC